MQHAGASSETDRLLRSQLDAATLVDRPGAREQRSLRREDAVPVGQPGSNHEALRRHGSGESVAATRTDEADGKANGKLVERLRAGDPLAFEAVVRQHGGHMLATARRFFSNDQDAQDAVQDAFLSSFKSIGRFSGESRLSTWLHRIVVNACLMKLRSRRRKPEQSIEDLLPRFDEEGHWVEGPAGWDVDNETLLQRRETREMVRDCINRLPETYRTVLLIRDIEELDTDEAAETLGVTSNAVKIRLHRARQALRTLIERELNPEPVHHQSAAVGGAQPY